MGLNVENVEGYGPLSSVRYLKEGYAVGFRGPDGSPWLTVYGSHYVGDRVVFPTAEDAEVRAAHIRQRLSEPGEVQVCRVKALDSFYYRIIDEPVGADVVAENEFWEAHYSNYSKEDVMEEPVGLPNIHVRIRERWTENDTCGHIPGEHVDDGGEVWDGEPLDTYELSADDLGCVPGSEYVIELVDEFEYVVDSAIVIAT